MSPRPRHVRLVFLMAMLAVLVPAGAHAYVGPGGIISGIGALLAAVAAIGAAIFGFFWYPLKRLRRKLRSSDQEEGGAEPATPGT